MDATHVMAMAMRKLQAFHLLTGTNVGTTTDVVLTIVQDLERPLRQAPRARLRHQAAHTDWDAELAALGDEDVDDPGVDEGRRTRCWTRRAARSARRIGRCDSPRRRCCAPPTDASDVLE